MADIPPPPKPGVCDGYDRGVTPERSIELREEAQAFNVLLRVNESDAQGPNHAAEVAGASTNFYKFLGKDPDVSNQSNDTRAFDASKAFYEQITHLPIGERRMLIKLAEEQNKAMMADSPKTNVPAMPELRVTMDSSAFINDMTIKYPLVFSNNPDGTAKDYFRMDFTFHYMGMCAEYRHPTASPEPPSGGDKGWSFPSFGFPFLRRK